MMTAFSLPNLLSLTRIPLAFLFFFGTPMMRVVAIAAALVTDVSDGFLARRFNMTSRLGVWLDPITDKFFVVVSVATLYQEAPLATWQLVSMFCRDLAIIIFTFYLMVRGALLTFQPKAIWSGKVSTGLQLLVLLALTVGYPVPSYVFGAFIVLGALALGELYLVKKQHTCPL